VSNRAQEHVDGYACCINYHNQSIKNDENNRKNLMHASKKKVKNKLSQQQKRRREEEKALRHAAVFVSCIVMRSEEKKACEKFTADSSVVRVHSNRSDPQRKNSSGWKICGNKNI
jgi:hypothetical protein